MKFWLVCFGLLFAGAELLQWFAELGSRQPSGAVLILGGMGLAAVSNAAHLPKMKGAEEDLSGNLSGATAAADCAVGQSEQSDTDPTLSETQSERRSISFKVRFPFT